MLANNTVINELYNKINEHKAFQAKTYSKRASVYFIANMLSFAAIVYIALTEVLDSLGLTGISFIILLPIMIFTAMLATHTDIIDAGSFFWTKSKSQKILNTQEQEIIDHISKEETQIEIFNFNFSSLSQATVNELKKSLALKEYSNAYNTLFDMLNSIAQSEKNQLTESQTKKLIAEYELDLKMKL